MEETKDTGIESRPQAKGDNTISGLFQLRTPSQDYTPADLDEPTARRRSSAQGSDSAMSQRAGSAARGKSRADAVFLSRENTAVGTGSPERERGVSRTGGRSRQHSESDDMASVKSSTDLTAGGPRSRLSKWVRIFLIIYKLEIIIVVFFWRSLDQYAVRLGYYPYPNNFLRVGRKNIFQYDF